MKYTRTLRYVNKYVCICLICFEIVISVLFLQSCANNLIGLQYKINTDENTCTVTNYYGTAKKHVVIPETYRGYTVVGIEDYAFDYQVIKSITIPHTVKMIGEGAFLSCGYLEAIYGFENCIELNKISDKTFYGCESLEYIYLPSTITTIGNEAFLGCTKLKNINFPQSLHTIGEGAFVACYSLSDIDFPNSLTSIGGAAFYKCYSLEEVFLPDKVSQKLVCAFVDCDSLANIYVSENSLNFSSIDGVLYNKDSTVLWCYPSGKASETYLIPNSVSAILDCAFAYNPYLTEIFIPKTVEFIDYGVFKESVNISTLVYEGTINEWQSIEKDHKWNEDSPNYTIICTDGTIAMDGTVTYN